MTSPQDYSSPYWEPSPQPMTSPPDYTNPYASTYWEPDPQPSPTFAPPAPSAPHYPPAQPYPIAAPYYAPVGTLYQPHWIAVPPPPPPANGMGIAGMVIGIIALLGGGLSIVLPVLGLILSIAGRNQAKDNGSTTGHSVAGIVCNSIALSGWVVVLLFVLVIMSTL